MFEVTVEAKWRSESTFEFETEAGADRFRERAGAGGDDGLKAIVEAGDVNSSIAELTDWEVMG